MRIYMPNVYVYYVYWITSHPIWFVVIGSFYLSIEILYITELWILWSKSKGILISIYLLIITVKQLICVWFITPTYTSTGNICLTIYEYYRFITYIYKYIPSLKKYL